MPELPEVEVTRQGIAEPLAGARVLAIRMGKPLRWPLGIDLHALAGAVVGAAARRGKYIWLPISRPPAEAGDLEGCCFIWACRARWPGWLASRHLRGRTTISIW